MKNVIEVKNLTKSFKIFYDKSNSLKERILFRKRNLYERRTILSDINFSVKKGESLGIIGRNGCGKSTLLKLLTGIIYPDSGTININGKVSSLIELGAGFHPDMSGRENIYINASIYGLTKKQIEKIIDDIISFSELEEFIDNPVRTYSSGMYMRLAFSVAIHVDAQILLIDEILAVGDIRFQEKCFNKLKELKSKGVTIIIVSHSLSQISQICDKCMWIEQGKIKSIGQPKKIIKEYTTYMNNYEKICPVSKFEGMTQNNPIFQKIELNKKEYEKNDDLILTIKFKEKIKYDGAIIRIDIFNLAGVKCYEVSIDPKKVLLKNKKSISLKLYNINFSFGTYVINAYLIKDENIIDSFLGIYKFNVITQKNDSGILSLDYEWIVDDL